MVDKNITFHNNKGYQDFVRDLKAEIKNAQIRTALSVNTQLIKLYWTLGLQLTDQMKSCKWGTKVIDQLSIDLSREFKDLKGFSRSNLYYIYKWYNFYKNEDQIVQQLVGQIPWGHNITIITKIKEAKKAIWYIQKTISNNWSRSVLLHQIDLRLYERQNTKEKITSFHHTLPKPQSDLAEGVLKDPYIFDFLSVGKEAQERELEKELTKHIQKFLLELGAGFAFIGNQYHLEVDKEDYYLDMLFYHLALRCYVVIELKAQKFKPEYAGKLNFYLSAVDDKLKGKYDNPTIGVILCKDKGGKIKGEYALKDINKPIGLAEYKIVESLPKKLKTSLPTIEELEKELSQGGGKDE